MKATRSNTADQGCAPVSSNCVIWQGPSLSCINLCNGDSVSDVVYKLAVELCNLQAELDLSDLDLSCLVEACQNCPEPEKTLSAVLGLLIDKVCTIEELLGNSGGGSSYLEPVLTLPSCLQYSNAQGQTITNLQHSDYTLTLATKICQINTTVNNHTSIVNNHETRIGLLENAAETNLPTVTPNCILPAVPTQMNIVLDELENQYCQLRGVLGTNAAITTALAQQCNALGAANKLSGPGTMATIPGWKTTVTTFADSFQNLWLTICDMRSAIVNGSIGGGSGTCADFILGFTASANSDRSVVTLFFNGGNTVIPAGYDDCIAQGSKVTIQDSNGTKYTSYVVLNTAISNNSGVAFTVTGAGLNTALNYTVTVEGCVSNGSSTCSKTASKELSVACGIVTNVTATLV